MGTSSQERYIEENNMDAPSCSSPNENSEQDNSKKNNFGARPIDNPSTSEICEEASEGKNIIRMKIKFEQDDINRPSKILYNLNEKIPDCDLKELNESNTELYINGKHYKYKSYFCPDKAGIYDIQLNFNFLLKNCCCLFYGLTNLISVDLSSFNTEKVTNMSYMFYNCSKLKNLDLTLFNTEKVTNMSYMFYNCSELESLNLSSFNTEKVTNINYMFYKCSRLKILDLSSFNTQNIEKINVIFDNYNHIERVILSYEASNISKFISQYKIFYA